MLPLASADTRGFVDIAEEFVDTDTIIGLEVIAETLLPR